MPGNFEELLFTSGTTALFFERSARSEVGGNCAEQAVCGPLQHLDLRNYKLCEEMRIDAAARYASSLSFAFSTDNGASYSFETQFSISASSNASQSIAYPQLTGNYFTPRIASTNGGWELRRWYARFIDGGQAR